ncbi:hypothetical protein M2440_003778 [Methylorubrum extorquens]|nr:hypothetical protein [Methylorubrum extorquens]
MNAIFLRRAERGGDDEVALVLTIVVVGDDDDLAAGEGFDGLGDAAMGHGLRLVQRFEKSRYTNRRSPIHRLTLRPLRGTSG